MSNKKEEHMLVKSNGVAAANNANADVADLMRRLQAAEAAVLTERARAEAAEAAKAAPRGYSAKVSEKGAISIFGVNAKFPVTLYAPHFVGIVLDLIATDKGVAFLRENADRLSVKVSGESQAGTDATRGEVNRLADRLADAVARLK
jgi:hypothetical protein